MKVNVIGTGGREHALRTVLARTAMVIDNPDDADLIVIGPEAPLVAGLADEFRNKGKLVYGPGADGARLEGSKEWMKDFVHRAGVPTARYGAFDDYKSAEYFLSSLKGPYVVKTDGLAAGKGVLVTDSFAEACEDIRRKLSGEAFGAAGNRIVIEEAMAGPEVSLHYIFDGKTGAALPLAQDFKRAQDGDRGPNTGGMGAYTDVLLGVNEILDQALERIIEPTCSALRREGIDYRGTLYAGLMLTEEGPKLVEYNVRFGDPEAQVVLTRFNGDLAATLASVAVGSIQVEGPMAVPEQAVCVTLASAGYPLSSRNGDVISGIEEAEELPGVTVFHAGVERDGLGRLVTAGGRVLNVTALAPTLAEARQRAYEGVKRIHFEGMQFRSDIALNATEEILRIANAEQHSTERSQAGTR